SARTCAPAARHPAVEARGRAEMPVVPHAALFAAGAYDQADRGTADRALSLGASGRRRSVKHDACEATHRENQSFPIRTRSADLLCPCRDIVRNRRERFCGRPAPVVRPAGIPCHGTPGNRLLSLFLWG